MMGNERVISVSAGVHTGVNNGEHNGEHMESILVCELCAYMGNKWRSGVHTGARMVREWCAKLAKRMNRMFSSFD